MLPLAVWAIGLAALARDKTAIIDCAAVSADVGALRCLGMIPTFGAELAHYLAGGVSLFVTLCAGFDSDITCRSDGTARRRCFVKAIENGCALAGMARNLRHAGACAVAISAWQPVRRTLNPGSSACPAKRSLMSAPLPFTVSLFPCTRTLGALARFRVSDLSPAGALLTRLPRFNPSPVSTRRTRKGPPPQGERPHATQMRGMALRP